MPAKSVGATRVGRVCCCIGSTVDIAILPETNPSSQLTAPSGAFCMAFSMACVLACTSLSVRFAFATSTSVWVTSGTALDLKVSVTWPTSRGSGICASPFACAFRSSCASFMVRTCRPYWWNSWQVLHQGVSNLLDLLFSTMPGLQGGGCFLPQVLQAFLLCAFHCWPRRRCSSTESVRAPGLSNLLMNGLREGCDWPPIC